MKSPNKDMSVAGMNDDQIKHMVDRFLAWRLPDNFNPDGGISFKREFNEHTAWPMKHEPRGTNLFDASQADAMVRYIVAGLSEPEPVGAAEREVGRWVYRRIEALMDAKPGTAEGAELSYLAGAVEHVEEYGEEHCGGHQLAESPSPTEGGWRPIEDDPPKDRFIILHVPASGEMDAFTAWAKWQGGGWYGVDDQGLTYSPTADAWAPTLWRDIPASPDPVLKEGLVESPEPTELDGDPNSPAIGEAGGSGKDAPWEPVAVEVLAAVEAKMVDVARKAGDDLYYSLLSGVQDYLIDNARFNIASRIESAERESANARRRLRDTEAALEAAKGAVRLILPLAKGYAPEGQTASARASCDRYIAAAEAAIEPAPPAEINAGVGAVGDEGKETPDEPISLPTKIAGEEG